MASSTNSNFAQSSFLQRAKEDTLIADVYAGATETISSYAETIKNAASSISNEISNIFKESSTVKDIMRSIDFNKPYFGLGVDDAAKALQGLGLDKGTIDSLRSLYGDHSFSNITSVLAGMTGISIIGEAGKIYSYVKDTNLKDINSLVGLVNKLTGSNFQLDGISSIMESVSFVIDIADKWGLTDLASAIVEKYKDNDNFKQTLINQLEVYVATANLTMINICFDKGGISSSAARVRCPIAEKMILGAYTIPSNVKLSNYAEEGRRLINTIKRFANPFPDAEIAIRNGQPYVGKDLDAFNLTSSQALTVLAYANSEYLPYAMIARNYRADDMYANTINLYK